jgi:hypothetical protein
MGYHVFAHYDSLIRINSHKTGIVKPQHKMILCAQQRGRDTGIEPKKPDNPTVIGGQAVQGAVSADEIHQAVQQHWGRHSPHPAGPGGATTVSYGFYLGVKSPPPGAIVQGHRQQAVIDGNGMDKTVWGDRQVGCHALVAGAFPQ